MEISTYNESHPENLRSTCVLLMNEFNRALPDADARMYHGGPVWFINDNPIAGYYVGSDLVNVLFWSGQSFSRPGLIAQGKFKAAGISYFGAADVDRDALQSWLEDSKTIQWDYKNLRAKKGKLDRL